MQLIHGVQLHKIRMPLPSSEHDPLMPKGLAAIGQALRGRLDGPWNWPQEYQEQVQVQEVEPSRGE